MLEKNQPLGTAHFVAGRNRIAFTYGLTLLENIFELLYPFALGLAVNGVIAGDLNGFWPLILIWFAHIVTGGFREYYDTRLFSRLFSNAAHDIITLQRKNGVPYSAVSARIDLMREFADFFEFRVPPIVTEMIAIIGGTIMIFLYDRVAGLILLVLFVPVAITYVLFGRSAQRLNRQINDQYENEVELIQKPRSRALHLHFGRLRQWRMKISNREVASWTFVEVLTLIAVIMVIYFIAGQSGALAGDIFAAMAYVLMVIAAIDELPDIVQEVGRLRDIATRLIIDEEQD